MEQKELKGIIHSDPEIMGGTPVFLGTRVPLQYLPLNLSGVFYFHQVEPARNWMEEIAPA